MRPVSPALIALALAACADQPPAVETSDPATVAGAPSMDGEEGTSYQAWMGKADGFTPPNGPLKFSAACLEGERITLALVGDVLLHARLQRQAFSAADRYIDLWGGVQDLLEAADVTYANLEGPTAAGVDARGRAVRDPGPRFDDRVYTSYPMFNYHPSLLDDLIASGVDVVSTANNHSLDRRARGIDRTIAALRERGLAFTGTRPSEEVRGAGDTWWTLTEVAGFRLAWLACSYGTNGIPDRQQQVLGCFEDRAEVLATVEALAGRADLDAVLVTPHWGEEYEATPNRRQVSLAHELLDAGALAVIGSHPHVLQPWERYLTAGGRETFVIYSMGNFVSGQSHLPRRSTLLLYLGLTRGPGGQVHINGVRYVPLHMSRRDGALRLEAIDRVGGLADSRALTVGMFYGWNVLPPGAGPMDGAPITNPHCDPGWAPPVAPHPHDGWIGGACEGAEGCGAELCLDNLPGGLCTERCDRTCPDREGRATTFCADLGFEGGGVCVARCAVEADCRPGWSCRPTERQGEAGVVRQACVPR